MATYLITGAGGYIGSMLIKYIAAMDSTSSILAFVRNGQSERALDIGRLPGVEVFSIDLSDAAAVKKVQVDCDYIIHCASVTKSSEMIAHPVEVIESIVNTTQNILELARRCRIKSMVYLSSMEVYGKMDCQDGHRVREDEIFRGEMEVLCTRSCYPLGKRMAENICYSYYREYGVPIKIARLAQTFGEGILPTDNRVFAQFARSIKERRDIVLHTMGNSMGNYCGIHDTVRGIITILEKGVAGEAYNVVNEENTMTIREMAWLVAEKIAGGKNKVSYDISADNPHGYAADTGLVLSGEKLTALGWQPEESLEEMYRGILV